MRRLQLLVGFCLVGLLVGLLVEALAQGISHKSVGCYRGSVRVADCECDGTCGGGGGGGGRYCPGGQVFNSVGRCIPAGTVDCGGDRWCPAGNRCSPHGCLTPGQIDCGTHICDAGRRCGSQRSCLLPNDTDCGDGRSCSNGSACSTHGDYCVLKGKIDCGGYVCDSGQQCGSGRQCVSAGEQDCGNGTRCSAGSHCSTSRNFCVKTGNLDCGSFSCGPGLKCGSVGRTCTADVDDIDNALAKLKSAGANGPLPIALAQKIIEALNEHARLRGGASTLGAYPQYIVREVLNQLLNHAARTRNGEAFAEIAKAYAGWAGMFGLDSQMAARMIRERTGGQFTGMATGLPPNTAPDPALTASTPQIRGAIDRTRGVPSLETPSTEGDPRVCWGDRERCGVGLFKFNRSPMPVPPPPGSLFVPPSEETPVMKTLHTEIETVQKELQDIRSGAKPFADPYVRQKEETKVVTTLKKKAEEYEKEKYNSRKIPER